MLSAAKHLGPSREALRAQRGTWGSGEMLRCAQHDNSGLFLVALFYFQCYSSAIFCIPCITCNMNMANSLPRLASYDLHRQMQATFRLATMPLTLYSRCDRGM